MNKAQIVVLAVAITAGGGAFMMMNASPDPAPVVQAPPPANEQVLVAARDLSYGTALNDPDTNWVEWPKNAVPNGVVRRSDTPNAKDDIKGLVVRTPISSGEPVRRERLVKGRTAGLMSTMLPAGRRAVAIDVSPNTTAGGFILPNDHVDVIRTFRDQELTRERGSDVVNSEVILTNVRVLAMGQTVETKNGESVVSGATATLDLDPRQAELVVLAQRTGQLSLVLRSMVDANGAEPTPEQPSSDQPMTVVRFGVPATIQPK